MPSAFTELTGILLLATTLTLLIRTLKQPPIIAYMLTGILVGPLAVFGNVHTELLEHFANVGIMLVLFLLGLELRLNDLRSIGKKALAIGLFQIIITTLSGIGILTLAGFTLLTSLYIGLALAFSSTIIVVKLLADGKDLHSLHGKMAVGILLVQDFFAIIALMILAGYTPHGTDIAGIISNVGIILLKATGLFLLVSILSKTILPPLLHRISRSQEVLFLFSLAWVFGIASLVSMPWVGFSIEIGGFLAGLALANAAEHIQIAAKLRSLRDFFIIIFFITLGFEMQIGSIPSLFIPALLISMCALLVKPLSVYFAMGLAGYEKRSAFFTALHLSQVSEFSLILMVLGNRLGYIDQTMVSLITLVGIITFVTSTYGIRIQHALYIRLGKHLPYWKRTSLKEQRVSMKEYRDHIVLIGAQGIGRTILDGLEGIDKQIVVIDFDPDVASSLQKHEVPTVFGDIRDIDILDEASVAHASLVISTINDLDDNQWLIAYLTHHTHAQIIVIARDTLEAKQLYSLGADYVVLTHIAGGKQIARAIRHGHDKASLSLLKQKDLDQLEH
jgi:Kef-type K+ transport system membrane component KefB